MTIPGLKALFQIQGVFQDQGKIQGIFQFCGNPVKDSLIVFKDYKFMNEYWFTSGKVNWDN